MLRVFSMCQIKQVNLDIPVLELFNHSRIGEFYYLYNSNRLVIIENWKTFSEVEIFNALYT